MYKGYIRIEIEDGEIKKIMDQLTEAQETIYKCYSKLQDIGVLTIVQADDKESRH